jgi:hypothetical protein
MTHTLWPGEIKAIKTWLANRNYGEIAGLTLSVHPHQLRHACGCALADQGDRHAAGSDLSRTTRHPAHRHVHDGRVAQLDKRCILRDVALSFQVLAL